MSRTTVLTVSRTTMSSFRLALGRAKSENSGPPSLPAPPAAVNNAPWLNQANTKRVFWVQARQRVREARRVPWDAVLRSRLPATMRPPWPGETCALVLRTMSVTRTGRFSGVRCLSNRHRSRGPSLAIARQDSAGRTRHLLPRLFDRWA